jgi:hypothetical protein
MHLLKKQKRDDERYQQEGLSLSSIITAIVDNSIL